MKWLPLLLGLFFSLQSPAITLIGSPDSRIQVSRITHEGKLKAVQVELFSLGISAGNHKIVGLNEEAYENLQRDLTILNRSLSMGKHVVLSEEPSSMDFADSASEILRTAGREDLVFLIQGLF